MDTDTIETIENSKFVLNRCYYSFVLMCYDKWKVVPTFDTWVYKGWTVAEHSGGCPRMCFIRLSWCGVCDAEDGKDRQYFRTPSEADHFMLTYDELMEQAASKKPPWDMGEKEESSG